MTICLFLFSLLLAAYWNLTLPAVLCSEELTQFEVYHISLAVALHSEIQVTNTDLAYFRYTLDIAFLAVVLLLH